MDKIILATLIIIAVAEIYRLSAIILPISRKEHFKKMLKEVQKKIWDLEFKVFKTKEIREEIRQEYDFMNTRIDALKKQLETFKGKKDEKGTIEDNLTRAERDAERLKKQLGQLDLEINGSKPTHEIPDGYNGIYQTIDSYRELVDMLKTWIKSL